MKHSVTMGGSTSERGINCPGSIRLCQEAPKPPSSSYADEGSLKHVAMDLIVGDGLEPHKVIGLERFGLTLTEDMFEESIVPAVRMFDALCDELDLEYSTETRVGYPKIPGTFGTGDILGRSHKKRRAVDLDWKFGQDPVSAENNYAGLFYLGAARETDTTAWMFEEDDADVEVIIIQPALCDEPLRWVAPIRILDAFVVRVAAAIRESKRADATIRLGKWCRWCNAKMICPAMNGEVDRALAFDVKKIDKMNMAEMLSKVPLLDAWIKAVNDTAFLSLENGGTIPGYKLVAKRAQRKWIDPEAAYEALLELTNNGDILLEPAELKSPAQMEKTLKGLKLELPTDLVGSKSSGNTVALESDPRPAVMLLGKQMQNALAKLKHQ